MEETVKIEVKYNSSGRTLLEVTAVPSLAMLFTVSFFTGKFAHTDDTFNVHEFEEAVRKGEEYKIDMYTFSCRVV